jgi:hypothetical protein
MAPATDPDREPSARKLPDQAALYGVLAQVETLDLELLELHRLPRSVATDADQPDRTTTAHPAGRETESRPTETGR